MPFPKEAVAGEVPETDGWQNLYDLVTEGLVAVLDDLCDAGASIPIVGYEFIEGNRIVAEAELAW